jgi:hypothetical protein
MCNVQRLQRIYRTGTRECSGLLRSAQEYSIGRLDYATRSKVQGKSANGMIQKLLFWLVVCENVRTVLLKGMDMDKLTCMHVSFFSSSSLRRADRAPVPCRALRRNK